MLLAADGDVDGQLDGGFEAVGVGTSGAGKLKCGAVVDGGAHDGKPQGDIDGAAEARVLEYRQALVVIHREHGVGLCEPRRNEGGVGRERALKLKAFPAQNVQHGREGVDFLASEITVLAGMRVETEHEYVWRGNTKVLNQAGMEDLQCVSEALW